MARQKKTITPVEEIVLDQDKVNAAAEAMRQEAQGRELALTQHAATVRALAQQLRYEGSTDPATLENSAREAIRRIGMGIFELGGYLLLLREACEHGQFLPALERLGLSPSAASRYMTVTRRFSANVATSQSLEAIGMSRLVELLPLDDEQMEDLTAIGQTGELKLDDVASMSVKELRAAVRRERQDHEATRGVLDKKNERIDKLERKLVHFEKAPADEQLAELQRAATAVMNDAVACVRGQLRQAVIALQHSGDERGQQDRLIAGLVAEVQAALSELRTELGIADVAPEAEPEFSKFLKAEGTAAKKGVQP